MRTTNSLVAKYKHRFCDFIGSYRSIRNRWYRSIIELLQLHERTEQNRTEQNRTEQNRTGQGKAEQGRAGQDEERSRTSQKE